MINVPVLGGIKDYCRSAVESDGQLQVPTQWVEVPGFQDSKLPILDPHLSTVPAENYAVANRKFPLATLCSDRQFGMQMPLLD